MKLALDACALIYFTKTNLLHLVFSKSTAIGIDEEVFEEGVTQGKRLGYKDAIVLDDLIKLYSIPIIHHDITQDIQFFKDKGETSAFLFSKKGSWVCVTSDRKAFNKFQKKGAIVRRVDTLLYDLAIRKKIDRDQALLGLNDLLKVGGTTPERLLVISKRIMEKIPDDV